MRSGETVIADHVDGVKILFCDLVGFTAISQALPAARTIDFLSRIFSAFDQLAAEHGVDESKTIGDPYMVVAGIPEHQPDHAMRIATLAPRMLESVRMISKSTALPLQ